MFDIRVRRSSLIATLVSTAFVVAIVTHAEGSGHDSGMLGTVLGGGLVLVGGADLVMHKSKCTSGVYIDCARIALDVAAIGGGLIAMMANSENADQTKSNGLTATTGGTTFGDTNTGIATGTTGTSSGSDTGGSSSSSSVGSIPTNCKFAEGFCTCNSPSCTQPQVKLPPKEELKDIITKGFNGNEVLPDGTSLQGALANLDSSYGKAAEAAALFNAKSDAGAFDPDSTANLAGGGKSDEGVGLQGRGIASNTPETGDSHDGFGNTPLDTALKAQIKARGPDAPVKATGLNVEDARTGRILTIWERNSRALRGGRDRDILLARVEWTRKEAAIRLGNSQPKSQSRTQTNFAIQKEKP